MSSDNNNTGLMNTEPGGENTQYESVHTFVDPPAKQAGLFGGSADKTASPFAQPAGANKTTTTNLTPADKIRYGQAMSEDGMGGQTGPGHNEGGPGADTPHSAEAKQSRREQGYDSQNEMARDVGA
ncbi:uncharacterized protein K452DRAFT_298751 [Aplosporella prunicola CBS 121167]|uniref:Uncharacterized protein n=1 Tax=Aplosporella prunicola CBS 121167 TaxID=1176127 RepID=A0A6A6BFU6_9PEZI|nr:uncharacterized protein K452DRAFT_298751 [Aplosporella prunicola CBS 121167]KAF2141371.1 hypothetical protein K452DRAFT_298751 [Aplosporella prunicola CBS 121167]